MQKETEKFNTSDIMEGMPSISAVIAAIKANNTDRKIVSVYIDKNKKHSKSKEIATTPETPIQFRGGTIIPSAPDA